MAGSRANQSFDVMTFGDLCVDLIMTGPDVTPQFGQVEKLVEDYTLEMGGSCCIFACQAAKLGLRTAVVGRVGDDPFGHLILRRLHECGVDTRHVIVDPIRKTGIGLALCPPGDRAILTYIGTINAVFPEDVTGDLLRSTRHLHHGSYYLHTNLRPAMAEIFKRAHHLGLTTSLDTNWDPAEEWEGRPKEGRLSQVLANTDIFMPNDQEAVRIHQALSGVERGLKEAASYFLQHGPRLVTIKAGAKGARVYSPTEFFDRAVQPVSGGDSIGAGDSFDAGFLAGWLRGLSIERCLEIASSCGRSVASQIGGLAGQLTLHDL
ncbi:MAG: sugar kinase [Chloroflexi bacterium]|nr:MAG: sugar kinase [Chloroflexota bacterium]